MALDLSVERHSTVAYFGLSAVGKQYTVMPVAGSLLILDRPADSPPPGPAELTIRSEGKLPQHRQIEILGPDPDHPNRLRIRR